MEPNPTGVKFSEVSTWGQGSEVPYSAERW